MNRSSFDFLECGREGNLFICMTTFGADETCGQQKIPDV
jgi:hypothetical protein